MAMLPITCAQVPRMSWPTRETDDGHRYFIVLSRWSRVALFWPYPIGT